MGISLKMKNGQSEWQSPRIYKEVEGRDDDCPALSKEQQLLQHWFGMKGVSKHPTFSSNKTIYCDSIIEHQQGMHITVTPPRIPSRNRHSQQLPSGSGSRPLRFYLPNQYTVNLFQALLPLGHRPASLLPQATILWIILMNTHENSFHSRPASPADVPAAPVPDFVSPWVKEQLHR